MSGAWSAKFSMRAILSFLIVGCFVGGSGITIVYHATTPQLIEEEITDDKTIKKYKDLPPLDESKLFNLWIGAILGYAGAIITFWYKVERTSDADSEETFTLKTLEDKVSKGELDQAEFDKVKKSLGL